MDSMHDLGGKQGFGPVDVDEPEVPFHEAWEGRMWGISRCSSQPDWTIDWWRHVRELIDPVSYLSRPYFDSWAQTQFAALIDSGVLTLEEVKTGKSATPPLGEPAVLAAAAAIEANRTANRRFDREIDEAPRFKVGDSVRARFASEGGHTRLPAYVRGRQGTIHAHHGAHVLADASARGDERAQHIYSVVFDAGELWPDDPDRKDRIFLDLWESYLEQA